jgi:NADPH:quinone reductase-like Zn-dependent oxidoreductase
VDVATPKPKNDELLIEVIGSGVNFVDTVVDVDVVRFLVECKADGVKIVHCSQYMRR